MSEPNRKPDDAPAHPLQRLLDNTWLLLLLGVAVPTASYTAWGLVELYFLPAAKLP